MDSPDHILRYAVSASAVDEFSRKLKVIDTITRIATSTFLVLFLEILIIFKRALN